MSISNGEERASSCAFEVRDWGEMEISAAESMMKVTVFSVSSLLPTKFFVALFSDAAHTVGATGRYADGDGRDANTRRRGLMEEAGCWRDWGLTTMERSSQDEE